MSKEGKKENNLTMERPKKLGLILVLVGAGQVGELDPLGVGLAFLGALCQVAYALSARHGFPSIPAPQAAGGTFVVAAAAYLAASLVIGYADLWRGGITVAPILLVLGYCVLIPVAILK